MRTLTQLSSSLRFRLAVLVALATFPPVLLTLHIARQDREDKITALRQRSQDITRLLTRKEEEAILGTRQLLRVVAASSQVQSGRRGECEALLRTLFADHPRYANLGVIQPDGDVLASAVPLTNLLNLADRAYFQDALSTRAFSIGRYQIGRITGKPSLNFGYPVVDPSGRVRAVVFAALDLDWLNRSEYALQKLVPDGATWTKTDGDGTILMRYPESERWLVGEPLPDPSLLKTILTRRNGVVEAVDPAGRSVVHDFTSIRSALIAGDVHSILSVPRRALFAEPNRAMMRNLTSVGLVAGLVLVIGWIGSRYLVLRPIQALVKFTARLGTGDASARASPPRARDELKQLTHGLDRMAETLERRVAERQQAVTELRQSEERFRALVQNSTDVTGITDRDGLILYVSPNFLTALGYPAEGALGRSIFDYVWPEDRPCVQSRLADLAQAPGQTQNDEYRLRHNDGSCRWIESSSSNHLENPAIGGIVFNHRDITQRKRAEARLRLQSAALESAANAIVITDRAGNISWANSAFTRLTGYSAAEIRDANIRLLKSDQHDPAFFGTMWQTLMDGQVWNAEMINRRKDGSRYTEENTITPVRNEDGEITHFIAVKQDITQRKQAEEKLTEFSNKLQVLSRRLVEAQETERRHIARELHDEIGQDLTAAEMHLQALLGSPGTAALGPRLKESLQVIERVQQQVRDLSLSLRPSVLDDLGLEPALRWYTDRQAALAGLRAELRADPLEQRLDSMIETECFRVAQEALTNVVKHARAHTVIVELTRNETQLHLSVRDDGVGFDVVRIRELAVRGASLGLLSMEERATLAGGGLAIPRRSGPGQRGPCLVSLEVGAARRLARRAMNASSRFETHHQTDPRPAGGRSHARARRHPGAAGKAAGAGGCWGGRRWPRGPWPDQNRPARRGADGYFHAQPQWLGSVGAHHPGLSPDQGGHPFHAPKR